MNKYIKYKRFQRIIFDFTERKVQHYLDELIKDGWELIYYNESVEGHNINIVTVCGKSNSVL